MQLLRSLFAVSCALLAGSGNHLAATLTNTPIVDTYFEGYGSENKNFGAEPVLRVDQWGGRQVFLRFALTNLPPGRRILQAGVRLFVTELGFNEAGECPDLKTCVGLYDVVTLWTESGLTYKTCDGRQPWSQGAGIAGGKYTDVGLLPKPDIGAHLRQHAIALDPATVTKNAWLELDVTPFLRERVRAGEKEINLLVRSSTLGRNYTFRSREAQPESERPRLRIETSDTLADFNLHETWILDWKPGQRSAIPFERAPNRTSARWNLAHKPAVSRTDTRDIAVAPSPSGNQAASAEFLPDVPGRYRVECQAAIASGPSPSSSEAADVYVLSVPPHPRLYVTPERLAKLRQNARGNDRLFTAFQRWVVAGSGGVAQGKFHDMGPHEGCENNALLWLLTGEPVYLSNSIAYAGRILQKPMREHFRDVHEATFVGASWVHAMALHYDWCFDQLPAAHCRAVADWLKEAAAWGWARSGAPIAHNDGGARQCLLASAALALLGDDPEAPDFHRRSHDNFEQNLLPWLNDGGRGGRSGDGGEYEGLHAFYIVKYAWMAHTATGEDVFSESPFFFNRIRHVLFGWYPRRLVAPNGGYSMRQYYSPSGDHIRLGYVGDTQPYQSAAALCARFQDTPEAQGLRWLAGEWPTQWMQYCLKWAVLADWEHLPAREPKELAYRDAGCNTVFARSDWSDDATWILFENSPFVSVHGSLDSGTFEIFKGDLLAPRTGNLDHANVGTKHVMNYLHRTVAANGLLIHDPNEKWKGFLGGAEGIDDGGGERTNWPLTSSPDADTYLIYRPVFQRGQITRFKTANEFTYALADLAPAYTSPYFHNAKLNQPKVTSLTRQLLYLRGVDALVVFDRVSSAKPGFRKAWLLHAIGDLDVLDGTEAKVDDGEVHYTGATRAVIRCGWPKPAPSFGRCLSVTLLPENALITKIGGRIDLPEGQTAGWAGDQWHGQHRHRHLKDFWVNGTNYPPGNPPETRWFGEPTSKWFVAGTPDESGGRGKWRLEVSPPAPAKEDVFFHVLCPRLDREGPFPAVSGIQAGEFEGTLVAEGNRAAAAFFSRGENAQTAFAATLPKDQKTALIVADLKPGEYVLSIAGQPAAPAVVGEDGVLMALDAAGAVRAERR